MKKNFKRHCIGLCGSLLIGLSAAVFCVAPSSAAQYNDVEGHWAQSTIEKWSDSGILSGYPDGTFKPDRTVTRSELSSILYNVWGCMTADSYFNYPDVKKGDWYYDSLSTMNAYGIALNDGNAMFPGETLTREEAAYMIAKTFFVGMDRNEFTDGHTRYLRKVTDYQKITGEYSGRLSDMLHKGYITGYPDGSFGPQDPITRAQVITMINKMAGNFISSPGTYEISMGDRVVITCSDVTINIKKVGDKTADVYAYLMNEAAKGGVTFVYDGSDKAAVGISYVSDGKSECKTKGNVTCGKGWSFIKGVSPMPDTRYGGGQGTKLFPYVISNAEQLALLEEQGVKPAERKYFILDRDLNLGSLSAPFSAGENFICANLDGAGHTITYNMSGTLDCPFTGLFDSWYGSCSNLTVAGNIDLTLSDSENLKPAFGGFAGYLQGNLTNCISTMEINIETDKNSEVLEVGGLAGFAIASDITNCTASTTIQAKTNGSKTDSYIGGLIGNTSVVPGIYPGSKFIGCGTESSIHAKGGNHICVGGLTGGFIPATDDQSSLKARNFGLVENCWSTATVSGSEASFQIDCGGLIGQSTAGSVKSSWATPILSIEDSTYKNIGSIAGACYDNSSISDCWGSAEHYRFDADTHVGGITGRLRGAAVTNCYVLGTAHLGNANAITFESWNEGTVSNCFDFTGKTKSQIDTAIKDSGWNFETIWEAGALTPTLKACDAKAQTHA